MIDLFSRWRRDRPGKQFPIGVAGPYTVGGYLVEEENNPDLRGNQKYRTFSDLINNVAIVAAGIRLYFDLIARPSWVVTPADDSDEAKRVADFVREEMEDLFTPWSRIVARSAMYRFYGFSLHEWIARRRPDGQLGFMDVSPRPQRTIERWDLTDAGYVKGVWQRRPVDQREVYIPAWRLVYLVDDSLDASPMGSGVLRHVVKTSKELQRLEQLEGWGYQSDLRGVPVGKAPIAQMEQMVLEGRMKKEDFDKRIEGIKKFITQVSKTADSGMLLDSQPYRSDDEKATPSSTPQWSMELLQADSAGHEAVSAAIERKNREIARVLGVEQLLLGSGQHGSMALSQDKSANLSSSVDTTNKAIAKALDRDFVMPLLSINGVDPKLMPRLGVNTIQYRDISNVADTLSKLGQAGVTITREDPCADEVIQQLGLSKLEKQVTERLKEQEKQNGNDQQRGSGGSPQRGSGPS